MRGFILGTIATAITFVIVSLLLPQIKTPAEITSLLVLAVIAGIVNGLIKPIVKLLSLPATMVTFGLFGIVINAGLLLLIAWIAGQLDITFTVGGFPPDLSIDAFVAAIIGGIVISIVGAIVDKVVPD